MSTLHWTRKRPTKGGYYWLRLDNPLNPKGKGVVWVYDGLYARLLWVSERDPSKATYVSATEGLWAGPVVEPEEPSP